MNNAAKHAKPRVDVRVRKGKARRLDRHGERYRPDKESDANGGGNGLRNMRERASQMSSARLAIEASAALRTTVDTRLHG